MIAEDLLAYSPENVRGAFKGELGGVIPSETVEQKASDFICAFESAENTIRILESGYSSGLFDNARALKAAVDFLKRPGKIELLVGFMSPQAAWFVEKLHAVKEGKVVVRVVPPDVLKSHEYDFMIIDETAHRFQENRFWENGHPRPTPVIVCGRKNQRRLQLLLNTFERIKILSSPWLPLPRGIAPVEPQPGVS